MNRMLTMMLVLAGACCLGEAVVKDVKAAPRWPWNGLVDISFSIETSSADEETPVYFWGYDEDRKKEYEMFSLTGDGANGAKLKAGGPYTVTWDSGKDYSAINAANFKGIASIQPLCVPFAVVDLSGGAEAEVYPVRFVHTPPDVSSDACRTTELWLRRIPAGTFTMGSPIGETGRVEGIDMAQHQVTITQMFYIGVFQCTQKQWELVMGTNPSSYKGDGRPVECVSYDDIRGTGSQAGAGWPAYGHAVDGASFMGRLQARTGLVFDLTTEAQWEYACRLRRDGRCWTTALNSGKNLTGINSCPNMAEVGRYNYNKSDGKGGYSGAHTKVGFYQPSELGLYDMHGNVWEWCLDWWGASTSSTSAAEDPKGPDSGSLRVVRGGSWSDYAQYCRAAHRGFGNPSNGDYYIGFRVACWPRVK